MNISLLFLYLVYYSICINPVIIPMKKKKDLMKGMTQNEVISVLTSNIYNVELNLGTPYQRLLLNIRLNDHFTYVIGENAEFEDEERVPEDLVEFYNSSSSSSKIVRDVYFLYYIFKTAYYLQDNAKIGNINIQNLTLIQAQSIRFVPEITSDSGIFGLGLVNAYESGDLHSNFIYNLKDKGIIDTYSYFFDFDSDSDNGRIVIGIEPNEYNATKYPYKMNSYTRPATAPNMCYWGFQIDGFEYNGIKMQGTFSYAKLQLDYGFILVGNDIKKILDDSYFNELKNNNICEEAYKMKDAFRNNYICKKGMFDKSKLKKLIIYVREFEPLILDLSKLFFDFEDKSYFLIQFSATNGVLLGEPFIKNL